MKERRTLNFRSIDDIMDDVRVLRAGHRRIGNWSLPQVCRHLNIVFSNSMRPGPFPPDSAEQQAMSARLDTILASGQLPKGIKAPEIAVPPPECDDSEIDRFFETLEKAKAFKGPFAPHRLFGTLSDREFRQLMLIHAAHHLSHLHPNQS